MSVLTVPGYLTLTWTLAANQANAYNYARFISSGGTIQTGDFIEYDVFWVSAPAAAGTNYQLGLDMAFSSGAILRGTGQNDQNGLSPHPAADLSAFAVGQWYSRRISLSNFVGLGVTSVDLVSEGDVAGTYVARYRNIRLTNGGADRVSYYQDATPGSPPANPTFTQYLTSATVLSSSTQTTASRPSISPASALGSRSYGAGTLISPTPPPSASISHFGAYNSRTYGTGSNVSAPPAVLIAMAATGQASATATLSSPRNIAMVASGKAISAIALSVVKSSGDVVVQPSTPLPQDIILDPKQGPNSLLISPTGQSTVTIGMGRRQQVTVSSAGVASLVETLGIRFKTSNVSTGVGSFSTNRLLVIQAADYFTIYPSNPPYADKDVLLAPNQGPSQNYAVAGSITGRTTPSASLAVRFGMSGSVSTGTTLRATLAQELRPTNISCGTSVTGQITSRIALTGAVACRTTVTAAFSLAIPLSVSIACSTVVTANLRRTVYGTGNISCGTLVTSNLSLHILRGTTVTCGTSVFGSQILNQALRPVAIVCNTRPTVQLRLALFFAAQSINARTTLTSRLTTLRFIVGAIHGSTSITNAPITISNLAGRIYGRTVVTVTPPLLAGKFFFNIFTGTTVTARPSVAYASNQGSIACGTTFTRRTFIVAPRDFYPINIETSTRPQANLRLNVGLASGVTQFIHGRSYVSAFLRGFSTISRGKVDKINAGTTVASILRAAFGGDVITYTITEGILDQTVLLSGGTIRGRTYVNASGLKDLFTGRAWGGTRFAYTYGTPDSELRSLQPGGNRYGATGIGSLHYPDYYGNYDNNTSYYNEVIRFNVLAYTPNPPKLQVGISGGGLVAAGTRFKALVVPDRSFRNPPYYGPSGSVSLRVVPKGDLGYPSIIVAGSNVAGQVLVDRHRNLWFYGDVGLTSPVAHTFSGSASRGTGTHVANPAENADQTKQLATLYT